MGHKIGGRKFDRETGERSMMYRNLVTDLLRYEKITTTEAKAKEIQAMAEKMITMGKKGNLSARRDALAILVDESVASKLFSDLPKRYAERHGAMLESSSSAPRQGDWAPMVRIELVE